MFEKCEQATTNPDLFSHSNTLKSTYDPSPAYHHQTHYSRHSLNYQHEAIHNEMKNFDQELRFFLNNNQSIIQTDESDMNGENQELSKTLDEMILKAILVLRIHLFEMEKVNELCRDFSERYIETLKITLNSDNMFKSDEDSDEMNESTNDDKSGSNQLEDDQGYKSMFYVDDTNPDMFNRCRKRANKPKAYRQSAKSQKKGTRLKVIDKSSYEISPDTCLSKISFNMLNITGGNNDSSYQSVCSEDEITESNLGKICFF